MGSNTKISAALAVIAVLAAAIVALVLLENLGPGREVALSDPGHKIGVNADHETYRFAEQQTARKQGITAKQEDPEAGTEAQEKTRTDTPSPQRDDCVPDDEYRFIKFRIVTPSGDPVVQAKVDLWKGRVSDLLFCLPAKFTYRNAIESHFTDSDGEFEVRAKRSVLSGSVFTVSSATAGATFFSIDEFEIGTAPEESEPRLLKAQRARSIRNGDQVLNVLVMGPPVSVNGVITGQGYEAGAKFTVAAFPGTFKSSLSRRNISDGVPAIFRSAVADSMGRWQIQGLDSMQPFTFLVFEQTSRECRMLPWEREPGTQEDPTIVMRVFEPGNLRVRVVGVDPPYDFTRLEKFWKERAAKRGNAIAPRPLRDLASELLLERMEGGIFTAVHTTRFTSLDRGYLLIPDIEEGFYRVTLTVEGYRPCVSSLPIEKKGTTEVVFAAEPCMTISGTVKNPDGIGIPGITVIAERDGASPTGGIRSSSAITRENGCFVFKDLHPGLYKVNARPGSGFANEVEVEAGAADVAVVVY